MGPFTDRPTGIGIIDALDALVAAIIVLGIVVSIVCWIFRAGQRSAGSATPETDDRMAADLADAFREHKDAIDRNDLAITPGFAHTAPKHQTLVCAGCSIEIHEGISVEDSGPLCPDCLKQKYPSAWKLINNRPSRHKTPNTPSATG